MLHRTAAPTPRRPAPSTQRHPGWCAQGHVCSADRGQEHRSHPEGVDTAIGRIVLTRVQPVVGRPRLEIRAVVDLPADLAEATVEAQRILAELGWALTPKAGRALPSRSTR